MEQDEWEVELEKRKIVQDEMITDMRKDKFITEINGGLGDKIKNEPNTLQKKEKRPSFFERLRKIFADD